MGGIAAVAHGEQVPVSSLPLRHSLSPLSAPPSCWARSGVVGCGLADKLMANLQQFTMTPTTQLSSLDPGLTWGVTSLTVSDKLTMQ